MLMRLPHCTHGPTRPWRHAMQLRWPRQVLASMELSGRYLKPWQPCSVLGRGHVLDVPVANSCSRVRLPATCGRPRRSAILPVPATFLCPEPLRPLPSPHPNPRCGPVRSIGALKWLRQQGYKHVKQLQVGW